MVAVGVILHDFHRLELLKARFLSDLVFAFIRIVLKVPHISNITHVTHLVSQIHEVTVKNIEGDSRACVP